MTTILLVLLLGQASPQPPKKNPAPAEIKAAQIERGSDERPLAVKVIPPTKTQDETAKEQADRDTRASAQWWTKFLGIWTVALAAASLFVYWIQAKRLRETIDKMQFIADGQKADTAISIAQAARAADEMAKAAVAATKTADIAEQTMRLAGRPHLAAKVWTEQFVGGVFYIEYQVSNAGRTPAKLIESLHLTQVATPPPKPRSYKAKAASEAGMPVFPGSPIAKKIRINSINEEQYKQIKAGALDFWFYGFIRYEDDFGVSRITGFCITFELGRGLVTDKDTGYNYAE